MRYIGNVIRPPAEANSMIIQLTLGCSHNKCLFCPAYKTKKFQIRKLEDIFFEIDNYALSAKRIFFADGDVLSIPFKKLKKIFEYTCEKVKKLNRIGVYGSTLNLMNLTVSQLEELKKLKLRVIYNGIETGCDKVLEYMKKGINADNIVEQLVKVEQAGIKRVVTVLLGIGGRKFSKEHSLDSANILNRIQPEQLAVLTTMIIPQAPLYNKILKKEFILPTEKEMILELKDILINLKLKKTLFLSDHASNYISLKLRLPKDLEYGIKLLDLAYKGGISLRKEYMRGL